jgi:hypothetical protein
MRQSFSLTTSESHGKKIKNKAHGNINESDTLQNFFLILRLKTTTKMFCKTATKLKINTIDRVVISLQTN